MLRTSSMRTSPNIQRGFTMIELLVVVLITTILVGLAVPSFTPLFERWRVRGQTENMQSSLYYARSEAIKRGGRIVIAKNPDTSACTTPDNSRWDCGWTVFHDVNGNGTQDLCTPAVQPNECTLQTTDGSPATQLTLTGSNGRLDVDRWGVISSGGAPGFNFEVIPKHRDINDLASARMCIGAGGRIKTVKGSGSC